MAKKFRTNRKTKKAFVVKKSRTHKSSSGHMTMATLAKIRAKNRRRSLLARRTDEGKKARIDKTGTKWLHNPNRYDVIGIDARIKKGDTVQVKVK